jgi:hypothetical protein
VQAGLVTKATIDPTNDWVFYASGGTKFAATFVDGSGSSLSTFLIGHGVNVTIGTPTLALKSGSAGGTLFALLFLQRVF